MAKIYTLSVECVSGSYLGEECVRVIEIPEDASLHSLHEAIQDAVNFDRDHLYKFYAGRNMRNEKIVYSEEYHWEDRKDDYISIRLNQIYPLKNMKLYYLFDFGDEWIFEIKKKRGEKEAAANRTYPRVIESFGPNPEQYPSFE